MSLGAHRIARLILLIATANAFAAVGAEWGPIQIGSETINPAGEEEVHVHRRTDVRRHVHRFRRIRRSRCPSWSDIVCDVCDSWR